jgi:membrane dipeptidase
MLIVDAHQDLAWNMLSFGRDYTRSVTETRLIEAGGLTPKVNGDALLGWPEYQKGCVALVFTSLFATPVRHCVSPWENTLCYTDSVQAARLYRAQLDMYKRLVNDHPEMFKLVSNQTDLEQVMAGWQNCLKEETALEDVAGHNASPVGLIVSMEGADCIRDPGELEEWWQNGVRIIGPAWSGNHFCGGTREPGPISTTGFSLLEHMGNLGFGLDLTHMDEQAVLQALDVYPGALLASHSNAMALLEGISDNRHLSDRVIDGILERDGIIGVVLFNQFLKPGWRIGDRREDVNLNSVVAQIDYICQKAGDARHVGLGTDFDGGFGWQSVPKEINSIADLSKLAPLLMEKGYSTEEIVSVLGENWIALLKRILP